MNYGIMYKWYGSLQDVEVYRELFDPLPKLVNPVGQDQPGDSTAEIHKLERQVNQTITSQEVVMAIEKLFQATPPNQHRGIVLQVCYMAPYHTSILKVYYDVMMMSSHSGWGQRVAMPLWNQCLIM